MQREKGAYAPVFYPAIILAIVLSLSGIFYPNQFASHIQNLQNLILEKFGWAYILAMSVFLCLCLILMFSRFGDIKLGKNMIYLSTLIFHGLLCCLQLVWELV
nr:BCCT family transporter [Francisella noatunensis]